MAATAADPIINELRGALSGVGEPAKIADLLAAHIGQYFECEQILVSYGISHDRVQVNRARDSGDHLPGARDFEINNEELRFGDETIPLPLFLSDVNRSRGGLRILEALRREGVRSCALLPLFKGENLAGWVECRFFKKHRRWRREDIFLMQRVADLCSAHLEKVLSGAKFGAKPEQFFRQILETSPTAMIGLDETGMVRYCSQALSDLFPAECLKGPQRKINALLEDVLSEPLSAEDLKGLADVISGARRNFEFFVGVRSREAKKIRHCVFRCESFAPQEARAVIIVTDLTSSEHFQEQLDEARLRSSRLVKYGNLIIVRTNAQMVLTDVVGDIEALFGLGAEEVLRDGSIWERVLRPQDLRNLMRTVREAKEKGSELSEEIRIYHAKTKETRWLLMKGIPLFSSDGAFNGWEGFGVDVTERRVAQEEIFRQHKRLEALFEVSRALQVNLDPAVVALKGLRALVRATMSDSGFACFTDPSSGLLEVVAAEGLSSQYLEELARVMNQKSLVRAVVEKREGLLIHKLQEDPRAIRELAKREGLQSAILVPLMSEDEVLGAITIFCHKPNRYTAADVELVSSAATQICLAARQAEFYARERMQADSLAVLYRLSHEVSKYYSPSEIGEHAFPVIQQEVYCRRIWLGIVNDQGTHLVGQAGHGPGVRQHVIDLKVALHGSCAVLDEIVAKKQPVIIESPGAERCGEYAKVLEKLEIGLLALIPMISLGHLVGVLVVEPLAASSALLRRKLRLLNSIANELATVIVSRRFEAKMADADKMRMAGVFASGVAHNFNNLLQAVMGQASLIEIQLPKDSPLAASAHTIVDSAARGGALIKQLLTFSRQGKYERAVLSVNKLVEESQEFYNSVLGAAIELEMKLDNSAPEVFGDYGQLQQLITNIVANGKEAVGNRDGGKLKLSTVAVKLRSGEVDPELPPGNYLRIDIEDNGVGMDDEKRARCFEPFFTTKETDSMSGIGLRGSGLGLSSAYSVARQHHGIITVRSSPGHGSQFSVYLPEARASRETAQPAAEQLSSVPGKEVQSGAKVILYEPDNFVHVSMGQLVESARLNLSVVEGREKLREVLRARGQSEAVLVINIEQAGHDVLSFLWELQRANDTLKIVALTKDKKRWLSLLGSIPRVSMVEYPTSVWSLHSAMGRVLRGERVTHGLSASVEVERIVNGEREQSVANAENVAKPPETSRR